MTKQDFRQISWLKKEEKFYEELKADLHKKIPCFCGRNLLPEESGNPELMDKAVAALNNGFADHIGKAEKLFQAINQVEDSEMRLILLHRFVGHKSWQAVAFSIGAYDESYPRKKFQRFLQKHESSSER